jgi:hypothetical protein
MKSGSKRFSNNLAKNYGLSQRAPGVGETLVEIGAQRGDAALTVNSVDTYVYNRLSVGRECSCLSYKDTHGELDSHDSDIDAPVILLGEDEETGDQDEQTIENVLQILEDPQELCPVCYGTGLVGGFKLRNSYEVFLDTGFASEDISGVEIVQGRPYYFNPIAPSAYIVFRLDIPSYYSSLHKVTKVPEADREHSDMSYSSLEVKGELDVNYQSFTEANLASIASSSPSINIKVLLSEALHGIFLRFLLSTPTIRMNFPKQTDVISSQAEFDWWESVRVNVASEAVMSTKDLLLDTRYNRMWRITNVEFNEPMLIDIGREVDLRPVRAFENYKLIP